MDHPRLLLLTGNAPTQLTGGGITLTNLFRGWPSDKLAVAHSDPLEPETEICERYFRLGANEIRHVWPLAAGRRIRARLAAGRAAPHPDAGRRAAGATTPDPHVGLLGVLDHSRELRNTATVSPAFGRWLAAFAPQITYTHLGDLAYLRLTGLVAGRTGCAVAVHLMDNWIDTRYRRGILAPFLRWRMKRLLALTFRRASVRLCVSERMASAYSARFDLPFAAFHNVLETGPWLIESKKDWTCGGTFTILYSGSIEANQCDALADCAAAVSQLHAGGLSIELRIHTPAFYAARWRARLERPGVTLHEPLLNREVAQRLAQADLLLLAVNFDGTSERYFRYSMPTKLPAYMLSGCPILVYGPPGIESVIYAREGGWAQVVDTPGVAGVAEALKALRHDSTLRGALGLKARETACRDHDAAVHRPRFQASLIEAARAWRSGSRA